MPRWPSMATNMKFYKALEIEKTATEDEIRKAYRLCTVYSAFYSGYILENLCLSFIPTRTRRALIGIKRFRPLTRSFRIQHKESFTILMASEDLCQELNRSNKTLNLDNKILIRKKDQKMLVSRD